MRFRFSKRLLMLRIRNKTSLKGKELEYLTNNLYDSICDISFNSKKTNAYFNNFSLRKKLNLVGETANSLKHDEQYISLNMNNRKDYCSKKFYNVIVAEHSKNVRNKLNLCNEIKYFFDSFIR